MPAIRSMLTFGKPQRRESTPRTCRLRPDRCARPFSSRIASLKFSMPRLSRVTPSSRSVSSFGSESVPGSHSNVTSSAWSQLHVRPQPIDQRRELLGAEERRRAAAEIDEAKRPAAHHRQLADQLDLVRQGLRRSARRRARSCRCRRGSSRTCSACGRTECAGTGPAASPAAGRMRAPAQSPATAPASTARTAGSWR